MTMIHGMKKELHRQWFDFFLNYAHKLFQDCKYDQCDDIVFFMLDTDDSQRAALFNLIP